MVEILIYENKANLYCKLSPFHSLLEYTLLGISNVGYTS